MNTTHEAERAAGYLARGRQEQQNIAEVIERHAGIGALKRTISRAEDTISSMELKIVLLRRAIRRSGIPLDERTKWAMAEYESIQEKPRAGAAAVPTAVGWLGRLWVGLRRLLRRVLGKQSRALPQTVPGTMRVGHYDLGDIPRLALLHGEKGWEVLALETFWPIQGPLVWMPVYGACEAHPEAEGAIKGAAMRALGTAQDRSRYQVGPGAEGEVKPIDSDAVQE